MFLHSFFSEKITKRNSGLLLFSAGIAGYYVYKKLNAPRIALAVAQSQKSEAIDIIRNALKTHYPLCFETMLDIYKAAGLMPLLEHAPPLEQPKDALNRLNTILQKMFLRQPGIERYELNDETFLRILEANLQNEYAKIGLFIPPQIDASALRVLLSKPTIWQDEPLEPSPSVSMAIIFGSTYLEYANRQNFFLDSVWNKKIRLILDFNNAFPVYLLGGDRALDPIIDKAFLDQIESLAFAKPSNEQEMMNLMFDTAIQTIALPHGKLVRISTDSPKEKENQNRPTTAGTLDSFVQKAKLQPNCDATYNIIAISSAPFIRYQRLVTQRQLLKHNIRNVNLTVMGPDIAQQMKMHSEVQGTALIAVSLDNLARELWEITEINRLQSTLTQSPLRRQKSLRAS